MPVVNFLGQVGTCDVVLQSARPELDAAAETYIYKVDLVMTLASRAEAELVGEMLPGLGDAFDKAGEGDNWKSTISVKPDLTVTVALTAKDIGTGKRQGSVPPGGVIIQGQAALVEMKASQSKRARTVMIRLKMAGHGASASEGLTDNLGRLVTLSYQQVQTAIPFPSQTRGPTVRVGMVVAVGVGDAQIVGRVSEIEGDRLSVSEEGREYTVASSDVISAFAFAQDSETQAALTDYAERCDRRERPVSWSVLVQAIKDAEKAIAGSGEVKVTLDDVERAAELLSDDAEEPTGQVVELNPAPAPAEGGKRRQRASGRA